MLIQIWCKCWKILSYFRRHKKKSDTFQKRKIHVLKWQPPLEHHQRSKNICTWTSWDSALIYQDTWPHLIRSFHCRLYYYFSFFFINIFFFLIYQISFFCTCLVCPSGLGLGQWAMSPYCFNFFYSNKIIS